MSDLPDDGRLGHILNPDSTDAEPSPAALLAAAFKAAGIQTMPHDEVVGTVALALVKAHLAGVAEGREAAARAVGRLWTATGSDTARGLFERAIAAIREGR